MKITNNSQQPQGVHGIDGLVFIQPGQTKDVDLTEGGLAQAKELAFLGIEGVARDLSKAPNGTAPANGTPKPAKTPAVASGLAALRTEYKAVFGKGPSPKWDADTLKVKIVEKAKETEPKSFDDMSDTELKVFLAGKDVATTDETRDELLALAKAA